MKNPFKVLCIDTILSNSCFSKSDEFTNIALFELVNIRFLLLLDLESTISDPFIPRSILLSEEVQSKNTLSPLTAIPFKLELVRVLLGQILSAVV